MQRQYFFSDNHSIWIPYSAGEAEPNLKTILFFRGGCLDPLPLVRFFGFLLWGCCCAVAVCCGCGCRLPLALWLWRCLFSLLLLCCHPIVKTQIIYLRCPICAVLIFYSRVYYVCAVYFALILNTFFCLLPILRIFAPKIYALCL